MAQFDNSTTKNPVLSRTAGVYDPQQYNAMQQQAARGGTVVPPRPAPVTDNALTLPDVVMKSAITLLVLIAFAVAGWNVITSYGLVFVFMLVAFGLAMANSFMKKVNPLLVLLYAAFEGLFLGGISKAYTIWASASANPNVSTPNSHVGIVGNAVIATIIVFVVTLVLFATGIVRATPRFQKMVIIAIISYAIFGLISLVSALFGVGGGWGFYGLGGIGIVLCLIGVGLAAMSLVLDFGAIQSAVAYGVPENESWRYAFGLTVTLVWLYLELLRLFAILQGRN